MGLTLRDGAQRMLPNEAGNAGVACGFDEAEAPNPSAVSFFAVVTVPPTQAVA